MLEPCFEFLKVVLSPLAQKAPSDLAKATIDATQPDMNWYAHDVVQGEGEAGHVEAKAAVTCDHCVYCSYRQ